MPNYDKYYEELFALLSAPDMPNDSLPVVAFGRKDPLVAHKVGDLVVANLAEIVVITGGIGKDSGDIEQLGYDSEAAYLQGQLEQDADTRGYRSNLPRIILEKAAKNGGDNARNSLEELRKASIRTIRTTAVAHAPSALRLAETLRHAADKAKYDGAAMTVVYRAPTDYNFDPSNPNDQNEVVAELMRLIEWPAKDWLHPQPNLPQNLVDFVTDISTRAADAPKA